MWLVIQITGSLLVLIAFVAVQAKRLKTDAWAYLWLNTVGSLLMAADALQGAAWGFLLLEGTWALVSGYGLVRKARGRALATAH